MDDIRWKKVMTEKTNHPDWSVQWDGYIPSQNSAEDEKRYALRWFAAWFCDRLTSTFSNANWFGWCSVVHFCSVGILCSVIIRFLLDARVSEPIYIWAWLIGPPNSTQVTFIQPVGALDMRPLTHLHTRNHFNYVVVAIQSYEYST